MANGLNKISSRVTQPKSQGGSQAMLYATGMTEADMNKAQVGIASVWYEGLALPAGLSLRALINRAAGVVHQSGVLVGRAVVPVDRTCVGQ